jgi:hypothetical protein
MEVKSRHCASNYNSNKLGKKIRQKKSKYIPTNIKDEKYSEQQKW